MPKVLFVSHVANFIKFNAPYVAWFRQQGWEVHYASMGEEEIEGCDRTFRLSIRRSPLDYHNLKAVRELETLLKREHYQIVHCHTPTGGASARLAVRLLPEPERPKVIYTAHGFHFYHGAPLKNWLLYYPAEKLLSRWTDCLITLNREDTAAAEHLSAKRRERISGVGVDLNRFVPALPEAKAAERKRLGIPENAFVLIYTAEMIPRKNQGFLLEQLAGMKRRIPGLYVLLPGDGQELERNRRNAKEQGIDSFVRFPGYCREPERLYRAADAAVSVSRQEGLPRNVMEAMACGLPVVASAIRGHIDLIEPGRNGFLYPPGDWEAFQTSVHRLVQEPALCRKMGEQNRLDARNYSVDKTVAQMAEIYRAFF